MIFLIPPVGFFTFCSLLGIKCRWVCGMVCPASAPFFIPILNPCIVLSLSNILFLDSIISGTPSRTVNTVKMDDR